MQSDIQKITTQAFTKVITFTSPDYIQSVSVRGFVSKHNMSIDAATGLPVNSRNAHVSVSFKTLDDAGYDYRNNKGEITLRNHRVKFTLFNRELEFLINEVMPSDTAGIIVCTLGEYIDR